MRFWRYLVGLRKLVPPCMSLPQQRLDWATIFDVARAFCPCFATTGKMPVLWKLENWSALGESPALYIMHNPMLQFLVETMVSEVVLRC
jgi:hypothetical protein